MSEPFLVNERLRLHREMADHEQDFAVRAPELYKETHCPNATQTVTVCRSTVCIAALRALGVEFTLMEGWDAKP
jgi:hypothetical protein